MFSDFTEQVVGLKNDISKTYNYIESIREEVVTEIDRSMRGVYKKLSQKVNEKVGQPVERGEFDTKLKHKADIDMTEYLHQIKLGMTPII